MSWSYEPGVSDKDTIRLLVGDTNPDQKQLHNEEIAWFLAQNSSVYIAASEACKAIAALYGRQVDRQVGDLKISASQRQEQYLTLAKELRRRAGRSVLPSAGGISVSVMDTANDDTDRVRPVFERGMFDAPGTSNPRASSST